MTTSTNPKIYQGVLWPIIKFLIPQRVVYLSDKIPTTGVAIPSKICPDNIAADAAGVLTTCFKKKNK